MPDAPRCRHLHTDGRQCGSPAVRHEKLCYQHLAARARPSYTPTLPDPEDLHAVQRGLAELLRLVSRELIEDRQAKRLFALLTAAGTNLARIDRQQRAARELDLRACALALAETRLASSSGCHSRRESASTTATEPAHHHPVILSEGEARVEGPAVPGHPETPGCPTFATASSSLRWDLAVEELPVTDPVDDPELGPIAPGPDPEPGFSGCHSRRESASSGAPCLASDTWVPVRSTPEQPSPARQRELDAEAAEQIEFDRQDRQRTADRFALRRDNYDIMYRLLCPVARLKEDRRRAQLEADYSGHPLPPPPYPTWSITCKLF